MPCTKIATQDAADPNFAHMVLLCWIKSDGNSFTTLYVWSSYNQFMLEFWTL